MDPVDRSLERRLADNGVSRRQFLRFCTAIAATLAVPAGMATQIAHALTNAQRLPVVWLEFQDCTGDTESFLRSSNPTTAKILLELISLNYHETLMVPAGAMAEKSLSDTVAAGGYVAVVEGAIPTANGGVYCTINGRTALDRVTEVCSKALATITVGSCAFDGGWPGARPNTTGAVGVIQAVPGAPNVVSLPGCPMNVVNFTAVIAQYLTNKTWPTLDSLHRPLFAYGNEIHEECPRKDNYEEGRFVRTWGDTGHQNGYCLFQMGCRGPRSHHNCDSAKWNDKTSWPIGSGHPCIGCAEPKFWDNLGGFYTPLSGGAG
jgi:hydrogenase small subunit